MFFSLNPSAFQGESSLKISAHQVSHFGGVREQTNKQTHSLTDFLLLLYSDKCSECFTLPSLYQRRRKIRKKAVFVVLSVYYDFQQNQSLPFIKNMSKWHFGGSSAAK